MVEQQHLVNLLQQKLALQAEIETLQNTVNSKKELYLKVQGAIEYLTQIGVNVPDPEVKENKNTKK